MQRSYFDHNATTPVSPEVLETMVSCLGQVYGNASSIHHFGQMAKQRLEQARRQVAGLIHCHPQEVVFTSGGTESDNLAILGLVRSAPQARRHVISTAIEHPAVLNTCAQLQREGVEVTYVPAGSDGVVDPEAVRRALRPETVLVSVMHANNELGTVQPIAEIAAITREAGIPFHSDGVQALGKIPLDVAALGVDLYSASGHKLYAPKGVGMLYVRKGTRLPSILFGGHHERERRPGTENVPGAAALGRAAELAGEHLAAETARLGALRDRLEAAILERVPGVTIHGRQALRTPNTSSLSFDGIEGEALVIALDLRGFAVSSGSACSSGAVEPSHVLLAIGLPADQARSTIRVSLGLSNTEEQVDRLVDAVAASVTHLRKISPVARVHA
ncbi:MAG TPA: cysteine desulfurase family protein [Bryobacteraceae bacterium]|nr:cysteine desulfurase family protein [Bryobacteraceae bacterium]